jgi:hypothetical protein
MSNEVPERIRDLLLNMPEYKYGVNRIRVTLADGKKFEHVHVAWVSEVIKVEGFKSIPFDPAEIVEVENDLSKT